MAERAMTRESSEPLFNTRRFAFTDPIRHRECVLVIPPDGRIFDEPKIGVAHPDCDTLADLSIELDCFYCQACQWNGRVSGAWCVDMIEESANGK